ncbi:MAG: cytochrome P460 family protein [Treponemataceae bacterium]
MARRIKLALIIGAAAAFLATGCAPKDAGSGLGVLDYSVWEKTTNVELDFPIPGHENHYRKIFINKIGAEYRKTGERGEYPDGTIVVKEIYEGLTDPKEDRKPVTLDIMAKDKKAPDSRGGWRWIVRDVPSGKDMVFKGDFCAACHAEASRPHPYGDRNPTAQNRDHLFY